MDNYETLLKSGITYHSIVFDNRPLCPGSKITVGEYLNIRPVGLNAKQLKSYYDKRIETIRKEAGCSHEIKERIYKSRMKSRIKVRILAMDNPCFFTQTFNDASLKIDYKRKIKAILGALKIDYCLVTDYGRENNRIHFHGFFDLSASKLLEPLFSHYKKTRYGTRCNFTPLLGLGYNYLVFPLDEKSNERGLNYAVKYMTKEQEKDGLKHKMFCSRTKKKIL